MVSFTGADVASMVIILNTGCFIMVMLAQHHQLTHLLDPSYVNDGFCLTNKGDIIKSSHALCFYAASIAVVLLWALCRVGKARGISEEPLRLITDNLPGLFIHGAAHMVLGYKFPDGMPKLTPYQRNPGLEKGIPYATMLVLFWYGFMRGIHADSNRWVVMGFSLLYGLVHFFTVPGLFAFAYVNCLLALQYALNGIFFQDASAKQSHYYSAAVLLMGVPTSFMAWLEALGCEGLMRPLGGHVLYDSTLSVGMLIFWCYAITHESRGSKARKAE